MALLEQGLSQDEVARAVGVDPRSVRRWKQALRVGGNGALKTVPASGRPPKLTPDQRKQLERYLLAGALAAGFPTDLWSCRRVAELIERTFGIRYHPDHIGRLVRSMHWGWSE